MDDENGKARHKVISLFSGAMGLDLGLESAGFTTVCCNEIDSAAVATIRTNRPNIPVISESVCDVDLKALSAAVGRSVKNIDVMAGGPPCQAFSVFGQRNGIKDSRGQLVFEFVRLVSEIKPKTFVMENVRGLHSMSIVPESARKKDQSIPKNLTEHGSLLRDIISRFETHGYRLDCFLVNSVNYGAPQIRERLICIGNRYNLEASFAEPSFSNRPEDRLPPFKTLGDAIGQGFVDPDPSLMNFSPRKLSYLEMVPPGGNWRSLPVDVQMESMGKSWYLKGGRSAYWRKLSFDFPSPTVVTMPNHAGTSMCHPTELRALTVGEMAAIQEFPTEWIFEGKATEKCRQIGNAVPTRLGLEAGRSVLRLLTEISDNKLRARAPKLPSAIYHIRPHVRTRSFYKNGKALAGKHCYYEKPEGDGYNQGTLFD